MDRAGSRSPEGHPSSFAMLPPGLADAYDRRNRARTQSSELKQAYEELSKKVGRDDQLQEENQEQSRTTTYTLAKLGIELAAKQQEEVQLEKEVVKARQASGLIGQRAAEKSLRQLSWRHISLGDELWRNHKKKMRLEEPGIIPLVDPHGEGLAESLLSLYRKSDPARKTQRRRPTTLRKDALHFYDGHCYDHTPEAKNDQAWCHVTGRWWLKPFVKVAHIVPFFLDMESMGSILFGSQTESLDRPGNTLLLSNQIKSWFDTYHLVIVPADATEMPIRRWRTDIISPDIKKSKYSDGLPNSDFDGKELVFRNSRRPVSRFMYFHFVMALVRIKDLNRPGWQDAWAKYYQQRPFPTPGPYMRGRMLLALATHFGTADLRVVDSWIKDNGFDTPLTLRDEEATEAARIVHAAVESSLRASEQSLNGVGNSSDEDSQEEGDWEEDDSDDDDSDEDGPDENGPEEGGPNEGGSDKDDEAEEGESR